jgi:hypothetical protein
MKPLGARKPPELLASMLEVCSRGHEANIFFVHLFLVRLQEPCSLAEKGDKL